MLRSMLYVALAAGSCGVSGLLILAAFKLAELAYHLLALAVKADR